MTVIARADTERGEVALRRREGPAGAQRWEIISNGVFLMSSEASRSEGRLAEEGLRRCRAPRRVLVAGLGIGFTLSAALNHPSVERVTVVEIEPWIVEWAHEHFGPLNGDALSDSRVEVVIGDMASFEAPREARFDALLFDVDNGPEWLTTEENGALYTEEALSRWRSLLTPGGVLGVWAASPSPPFLERLRACFGGDGQVEEIFIDDVVEGRPVTYPLYFARKEG